MTLPFATETTAARTAQRTWANTPLRDRLAIVREARFQLVERRADFTAAVEADVARAPAEVTATDLLPTASAARFLCESAQRLLKPRAIGGRPFWLIGNRDVVHRLPRGLVGLIGTWNYPVFLNAVPILHAITAGNAVLWKPSEQAVRTADVMFDWLARSGFPAGVMTMLPVTREAGEQLAEADIDFLHFTGSDRVGRVLAARLGTRLIPSALELSGCDALILRPDADVELAAKSAWYATTLNAGQTCLATRRVFVPATLQAKFRECLASWVERSQPVRLQTPGQVEQFHQQVNEARAAGCEVIRAKSTAASDQVSPSVIWHADPNLSVCREASFAPLVAVLTYADDAELHRQLAPCPFGLGASIFTADPEAAQTLANQLRAGHVTVNDVLVPIAHPATPFGGRGASGWGVTQGAEGLLEMTVPQVVSTRRGRFRPHLDALTPRPTDATLIEGILRLTHARRWRDRIRGLWQMIRASR